MARKCLRHRLGCVSACGLLAIVVLVAAVALLSVRARSKFHSPLPSMRPDSPRLKTAPDGTADRLMWMLQVSDLHLSRFIPKREAHFQQFLNEVVPAVRPSFVIASGDLTDARSHNGVIRTSGHQSAVEWGAYRTALRRAHLDDPAFWFDMRGNHDAWTTPTLNSSRNLFAEYSVAGSAGVGSQRVYSRVIHAPFGRYAVVLADVSPVPGPAAPFEYWASLTGDAIDELEEEFELVRGAGSNATFVAFHYTHSAILFSHLRKGKHGRQLAYIERDFDWTATLAGHFHLPHMHMRTHSGGLELEVDDMMGSRAYRVLALDNDLFSFQDTELDKWPLVLVTNPKDARHLLRTEPWQRMAVSTHVRALVFSPAPVTSVSVAIDGNLLGRMERAESSSALKTFAVTDASGVPVGMQNATATLPGQSGLYVFPWNPSLYASGAHTIQVIAVDAMGRQSMSKFVFRLDGYVEDLGFSASQALGYFELDVIVLPTFAVVYLACMIGLIVAPKLHYRMVMRQDIPLKISVNDEDDTLVRRLGTMHEVLWKSLMLFGIYFLIGPLAIVPVANDEWGAMFWWGAVFERSAIFALYSALHATFFLAFVYLPTVVLAAFIRDKRLLEAASGGDATVLLTSTQPDGATAALTPTQATSSPHGPAGIANPAAIIITPPPHVADEPSESTPLLSSNAQPRTNSEISRPLANGNPPSLVVLPLSPPPVIAEAAAPIQSVKFRRRPTLRRRLTALVVYAVLLVGCGVTVFSLVILFGWFGLLCGVGLSWFAVFALAMGTRAVYLAWRGE